MSTGLQRLSFMGGVHPALPDGMQRSDVEGLLIDLRSELGLSTARLAALLTMIRYTRPSDWTDASTDAVCYAQQSVVAEQLGKTSRALRADETALEKMGFCLRLAYGNGRRYAVGALKVGISFTPLIRQIGHLRELRDHRRRQADEIKATRILCSTLRREVRVALRDLNLQAPDHPTTSRLMSLYASWPRRFDDLQRVQALHEHHIEVLTAAREASALIEKLSKTSGQPDANFLPVQDTNKEKPVTCNGRQRGQITDPPRHEPQRRCQGMTCGNLEGERPSNEECHLQKHLTPSNLCELASDEMRFWITGLATAGGRSEPMAGDIIQAAMRRCTELGIGEETWKSTAQQMGAMRAALSVLIIDKNRRHPVTPVHNPAGALRAFAQRHRLSRLNLKGSIFGLVSRARSLQSTRISYAD